MATGVEEVHLKAEKGISAPSTPRRILLSHGRRTTADSPNGDIPMAKEKPSPNYLKPTISSCHDTSCRYPKSQQQHAEDSVAAAGAKKRLISVKSMEMPALPSSLLNKTPKRRTSNAELSPKTPKIVPEKASKAPTIRKTLAKAKSLPKSMPKRREANGTSSTTSAIKAEQEEKVLFIDIGVQVQGHAVRHGSQSPKSNNEGKQCTRTEESDTGKPRALPGKVSKKVCGKEGAPKKLKFQRGREREGDGKEAVGERLKFKQSEKGVEVAGEGKAKEENVVLKRQEIKEKDAPPAYNDIIGETATKLAIRRSKVEALVGAFESVISLQEPEPRPSQRQEEVAVKVGRVGQPAELKVEIGDERAERGQPGRVKPQEEVKVAGEEGYERGQPGQQQPEEEGERESGEEESKGSQWGHESQHGEMEGEEGTGEVESKGGQFGQESQHMETEDKETKGEEGDGVEEEDGNNVTKKLTESFENGGGESAKE